MDTDAVAAFRRAMQQRADTVHLITYRNPAGQIEGMTATAVSALSLIPPSLLVCINQAARAREAIRTSRAFGVSILRDNQQSVAVDGALAGGEKSFDAELTIESDPALTPVLRSALATLQCAVVDVRDLYTHTVFVGEVLVASTPNPGGPLLHHQGSYATVAEKGVR